MSGARQPQPTADASPAAESTTSRRPTASGDPRTKAWALDTASDIIDILRNGDPLNDRDTGHRFCGNCFAKIRDVEPPKPDSAFHDRWSGDVSTSADGIDLTDATVRYRDSPETAKAAIGFATPTHHTERGEIVAGEFTHSPDQLIRYGVVCECGATSHRQVERPVSTATAVRYARNLSDSINALREEYQLGPASETEADRITDWIHSRDVLERCVRSLKSDPEMQGKPIFRAALATALRHPNR